MEVLVEKVSCKLYLFYDLFNNNLLYDLDYYCLTIPKLKAACLFCVLSSLIEIYFFKIFVKLFLFFR